MEPTIAPHPRRFSFDMAAVWALAVTAVLAAIVFIPFVASVPFLYTKVSILGIGGLVALVFFVLARLTRGNVVLPPVALIGALWLVPLAYGLSTLFSGVPVVSAIFGTQLETDTFGFVVLLAAFATLAALAFRRTNQYRTFFLVGGVGAAVVLIVQVIFIVLSRIIPNTISATANVVGSFTDLGMFVGLAVIVTLLALRFLEIQGRLRITLWVGIAVALMVLALVNSVLVWVCVALTALGLFIEAIMRRRVSAMDADLDGPLATFASEVEKEPASGDTRAIIAPIVVLVISLFFLISGSTIGSALDNAFGVNSLDVRPSWQATFDVGSHTYASSPIFGSGPNTFGQQWIKYRDRSINDTLFWSVDFTSGIGSIPTAVVTTGVLGALAWLAFLALFLFIGLRALLFRSPTDPMLRFVSLSAFVGALYVFTLAVFSTPGPVVFVSGFLMLGIFISSLRYGQARSEWGIIFSRSPRVGFVIVFALTLLLLASVFVAYVVVERYLADIAYSQASTALAAGNLDKADAAIARSTLFAPSARAYQLTAAIGIGHMNKIANDATLQPSEAQQQFQAALSSSVQAALTATRLNPNDYTGWVILGNVYQTVVPLNIQGAYDNAKTAYEHAVSLNPTNPTLPFILAQLEIAKQNYPAAETDLTTAINLKHDYTQAIFLLSQLQVQEGKATEALQAAEAAAYFAPNDPTVLFQVGILRSGTGDTDGAIAALSKAVELNPQYANARFFLAVAYSIKGQYAKALEQLNAVAALSPDNTNAVASDIATLEAGRNPFPPSRLGALGIPQAPAFQTKSGQ